MDGKAKIVAAELDPMEEIKRAQELITRKTDEVKTKLARQLNDACETLKLLQGLGGKNILDEPQYAEFCLTLGIVKPEPKEEPKAEKKEKAAGSRPRVTPEEILKWIGEEEKSKTAIGEHFGMSPITVTAKLKTLEEDRKVTSRKDGTRLMFKRK